MCIYLVIRQRQTNTSKEAERQNEEKINKLINRQPGENKEKTKKETER